MGIVALVVGLLVLAVVSLAVAVDAFGRIDRARASPAIVLLGASVRPGGVASPALEARAAHAAHLYRQGLAPLLLLSGGTPEGPPSEAEVARALVVRAGVPASACIVEDRSRSTFENARF